MPKYLEPKKVRQLQLLALANGGRLRPFADGTHTRTVEWDIAGNCQAPVKVELHGRAAEGRKKMTTVTPTNNRPAFAELDVRCRKCDNCLRLRANVWRYRAMSEYRLSQRTWLATLTLRPEAYVMLLSKARVAAAKAGVQFEGLSDDEQFLAVDRQMFGEVQLWLKRLRKNTGKPIRYLAVTEAHVSGVPHMHLLLHEPGPPVRYKDLTGTWPLGFDAFKLVENARAAGYVTKYLAKELRARVRASQRYGQVSESELRAKSPPLAEANGVTRENSLPQNTGGVYGMDINDE